MSNSEIVKGIEIIDEDASVDKFETQLRNKGLPVLQIGSEKKIYAIGDSAEERETFNEAVEENAFALNLDYARAKLFYVNKETGQIRESKKVMERFLSTNSSEDASEGIPISWLPDLMEFIGESSALAEEDIAEVFQREDTASTAVQEDTEASPEKVDDEEEAFVDDVEEPLQQHEEQSATVEDTQEREPEVEGEPEQREDEAEETQEKEEMDQEVDPQEKENQDYLMQKAIELFDSHHPMSLPTFDELTHKELQERVLESEFEVQKARDKGINDIYHRLTHQTSESIEGIRSTAIKEATERHNEALRKIDNNYKHDVDQLLNEHKAEYKKDREDYVQSQIPLLRKKYDAEYYPDYKSALNEEIENLDERIHEEKKKEINNYETYVNDAINRGREQALETIRVGDIIEEYNKVAEEQKELLLSEAKQKKGEIGSAMQEMVKERDRLKSEIEDVQVRLEEQKQSEQERIDSSVAIKAREKEQEVRQENKEELDESYDKQKEQLQQIEKLESELEQEKQEKEKMKTEYINPSQEDPSNEIAAVSQGFYPSQIPDETSKFNKIKFAVGCGISVLLLIVLSVGASKLGGALGGIQHEMAKDNKFNELSYLADLEADERYDKAAEEMQDFGYDQESIAEMYMEHNYYISALESDKGILPEVYDYAASKEKEANHRKVLEKVRDSDTLAGKYQEGVKARIAILDDDSEKLYSMTNDEKIDNGSAKKSIQYFIDQKSFSKADDLLKVYSNKKLSEDLENAMNSNQDKAIEDFENETNSLEDKIEDKEEEADKLNKELDEISSEKEEQGKRKEMKENDEEKKDIERKLEGKNKTLEELKGEDQEQEQE